MSSINLFSSMPLKYNIPITEASYLFVLKLYQKKLDEWRLGKKEINLVSRYIPDRQKRCFISLDDDILDYISNPKYVEHNIKLLVYDTLAELKEGYKTQNKDSMDKLASLIQTDTKEILKSDNHQYIQPIICSCFFNLKKKILYYMPSSPFFDTDTFVEHHSTLPLPKESTLPQYIKNYHIHNTAIIYLWDSKKLVPLTPDNFQELVTNSEIQIVFQDISYHKTGPVSFLANILYVIANYLKKPITRNIICFRSDFKSSNEDSLILNLTLSPTSTVKHYGGYNAHVAGKFNKFDVSSHITNPEQDAKDNLMYNPKLIKWRQDPTINLDKITKTKCLIIGAGTLGSHVALNLLGWGITNMTFVDNGEVSKTNPTRQPLYTLADVSKPKCDVIVQKLKEKYHYINAKGVNLTIPTPGKPLMSHEPPLKDKVQQLCDLINEHDAIFLLTDSRESRWLPAVLIHDFVQRGHNKLTFTCGIGYDTYTIVRHCHEGEPDLSCYFCNDTLTPHDTQINASMDMMCTVSRSGLAPMASAIVSEMLISTLSEESTLPGQIRGSLYESNQITNVKSDVCICCGPNIMSAMIEPDTDDFIKDVIENPTILYEVIEQPNPDDITDELPDF